MSRSAHSDLRLPCEQRAFALDAPTVAGEGAVALDHAVARDRERERVGGASVGNRASRPRLADAARKRSVGHGTSGRNPAQGIPYPPLKRCAVDVQLEIEPARWAFD